MKYIISLLVIVSLVCQSCGREEPAKKIEAVILNNADQQKRAALLNLNEEINLAVDEHHELARRLRLEFTKLNRNYESTEEELRVFLRAAKEQLKTSRLKLYEKLQAMKSHLTEEEWKSVAKSQLKIIKQIKKEH